MQKETWQPLKKYEGLYEINESGEIRSLHKRNLYYVLEQRIDRAGYYTVRLTKMGITSTCLLHRLLAETFIENLESHKKYINHLDGNKLNNELSNLQWCTASENMKHAYELGLCKVPDNSKKVIDKCADITYDTISAAAKGLGISYSACKNYLSGKRNNPTCLEYV